MKTKIAIISPSQGIGGTERKFKIYYKYLDSKKFDKLLIYYTDEKQIRKTKDVVFVPRTQLPTFIKNENINYTYVPPHLSKFERDKIREVSKVLWNVNFTELYREEENLINLIISKTDYLKIELLHGKPLKNSYVVYNPIDYELWTNLSKATTGKYREYFKNKNIKFIVGRLARAEPSKWNYLIIATLRKLQKSKNHSYGFIFAGMPFLYRKTLKLLLSKKMLKRIFFLPELKEHEKIAEFYSSIDIFWQTSWIGESFGNVIAEAFCFEKPVITDFKGFLREDGTVNSKKYDAQIELVDHGNNGFYCNYPETIVSTLNTTNLSKLRELGKAGRKKVGEQYDAKFAGQKISKILKGTISNENSIPTQNEVNSYEKEYFARIKQARKVNVISSKNNKKYAFEFRAYRVIETIYLIFRKIGRKTGFKID